jgi:hypothetical protein
MGKRIGRKRLFALNKLGQKNTTQAGAGIKDSIGAETQLRSGAEIITEFQIDLGNATAPASSSVATGGGDPEGAKVIGINGASNSAITIMQNSQNGVIGLVEMICVEAPTGGEDNIGLYYGSNVSGSGAALDTDAVTLVSSSAQTLGLITADIEPDNDLDGQYLYLASTGSTSDLYTAGKFVIRLYGYDVFSDVS